MTTLQPATFGGVPSFFHAACASASAGGGYFGAGYNLARHVGQLVPRDLDLDSWLRHVDSLAELLEADDDRACIDWFATHMPGCIALVPKRRRANFIAGVRARNADEGLAS